MRIRLPLGRSLFFLLALLLALVALLPLRLATSWLGLDDRGLSAREVNGGIWLGSLSEARIGDAALGDLGTQLSPLHLLVGRARLGFERPGGGEPLKGAISISRNSFALDDVVARLPVATVFAPLPIASLDLSDLSVDFVDGQCDRAEGMVTATVAGGFGDLALPQSLTGAARCEAGALLLPLASQAGSEVLALSLGADGGYRAELTVRPADAALAQRLPALGFAPGANGYVLAVAGRF